MHNSSGRETLRWRRVLADRLATASAATAALAVMAPLIAIFVYLVFRGAGALSWAFLTHAPKPVGEAGGGIGNALVGSALILATSSAIGIPLGIGAGIYLAEYGRGHLSTAVRFIADVLNGVP